MTEEILNFIGTTFAVIIAYFLGLKGKKADVDIQKNRELNVVLSNLISSWEHLQKLSELQQFFEDEKDDLIFPKQYLPFVAFQTGAFDEKPFEDLGNSIEMLKQYDPVAYYNLNGINKKFDFIRSNYIIPFLESAQKSNNQIKEFNRSSIDRILNDIEENMRYTSKLVSKQTYEKVQKIIEVNAENGFEERKREINQEYYELIVSSIPKHNKRPSYEEILELYKMPEAQKQMQSEFDLIVKNGIGNVVKLINENPNLSIEEIREINNR